MFKSQKDYIEAAEYLKTKDKKLAFLIDRLQMPKFRKNSNYFQALTRAIIYQQLNGNVASKIEQRFIDLFKTDKHPTPEDVKKKSIAQLRKAGLSERKASYVKYIAEHFLTNHITTRKLNAMTDDEIKESLVHIKGVGNWTVDMFLMSTLHRTDILPVGDYGIRVGFKMLYDLDDLPDEEFMVKKAKRWHPYRTLASYYLWQLVGTGKTYKELRKNNVK